MVKLNHLVIDVTERQKKSFLFIYVTIALSFDVYRLVSDIIARQDNSVCKVVTQQTNYSSTEWSFSS